MTMEYVSAGLLEGCSLCISGCVTVCSSIRRQQTYYESITQSPQFKDCFHVEALACPTLPQVT